MSSLPWNSPGAFVCHCSSCDAKPEPACKVCGHDEIPLNNAGECAECAPHGEETCEEWRARVAPRRAKPCACTADFDAPDAFTSGYCRAHGAAWHTRGSR